MEETFSNYVIPKLGRVLVLGHLLAGFKFCVDAYVYGH
jgi:hypothetical protein